MKRGLPFYSIDVILAVGFRVRFPARHAVSPLGKYETQGIPAERVRHRRRTPEEPQRPSGLLRRAVRAHPRQRETLLLESSRSLRALH